MTSKKKHIEPINSHTYVDKTMNRKKFSQPSLTVPNQALTAREIIERHSRGIPTGGHREPIYQSDPESDGIKLEHLDPVDLAEIAENNKELLKKFKAEQKQAEKDKTSAIQLDLEDEIKRLKAEKKELEKSSKDKKEDD